MAEDTAGRQSLARWPTPLLQRASVDITYVRWHYRFIYLAVILDLYTRGVRGWWLSRAVDQQLSPRALSAAHPIIFHSDQGSQHTAREHTALLHALAVPISMAEVGQPPLAPFSYIIFGVPRRVVPRAAK